MKRKTVIILAAVVACILIATIIIVATTQSKNKKILAEISNQNPLFPTVDFIQSWYACDLTAEEWDDYFDVLKSLGLIPLYYNGFLVTTAEQISPTTKVKHILVTNTTLTHWN